mmetsp:Transcript_105101/g.307119  ORF Transcript_105101/g.307119 Transcript_105101/m.307119 type:complete len:238 (+) Transcript_105101:1234-1947(+)
MLPKAALLDEMPERAPRPRTQRHATAIETELDEQWLLWRRRFAGGLLQLASVAHGALAQDHLVGGSAGIRAAPVHVLGHPEHAVRAGGRVAVERAEHAAGRRRGVAPEVGEPAGSAGGALLLDQMMSCHAGGRIAVVNVVCSPLNARLTGGGNALKHASCRAAQLNGLHLGRHLHHWRRRTHRRGRRAWHWRRCTCHWGRRTYHWWRRTYHWGRRTRPRGRRTCPWGRRSRRRRLRS